jgi:hypothetical protein
MCNNYSRDLTTLHEEFIAAVFNIDTPMPAAEQKEAFRAILEDSLDDALSYEVVQTVHEQIYDQEFGETAPLKAQNIVDTKKFEVRTPDVVIQVNPERSDLVETRIIDGLKYILIRADEGVEVNGMNIHL